MHAQMLRARKNRINALQAIADRTAPMTEIDEVEPITVREARRAHLSVVDSGPANSLLQGIRAA